MSAEFVDKIIEYISVFLALVVVLSFHEFAHAFAAVKNGDITPKLNNRYTLNPLAHFDIGGLICFVFFGFGWAKPVPVNPNNFRKYKSGCFWVSIAGVGVNYIMSFLVYPLFLLVLFFVPEFGYFTTVLQQTLFYIYFFGLTFFAFNLLPLYPLDGFRVVDVFATKRGKIYRFLRNYGTYILYGLILLSFIADITELWYIDILGMYIDFVVGIINIPINAFWNFLWGLIV